MLLLPLLLLTHFIGDFLLQTDGMVELKHVRPLSLNRALFIHSLVHFILAFIISAVYFVHQQQWVAILWVSLIVGLSHFVIDICKAWIENEYRPKQSANASKLFLFILDQLLHVAVILCVLYLFAIHSFRTTWTGLSKLIEGQAVFLAPTEKVLTVFIIGICATVVSSAIVQIVTEPAPSQTTDEVGQKVIVMKTRESEQPAEQERIAKTGYAMEANQQVRRGRVIGYLERLMVVLVVCLGAYSAIAFIVAAKSLARFKKLDHQEWAEYFIVGTLCSLLCGTLSGFALKVLLNIHGAA